MRGRSALYRRTDCAAENGTSADSLFETTDCETDSAALAETDRDAASDASLLSCESLFDEMAFEELDG